MFIQRADTLAKLIEIRINLTFANWEHNVCGPVRMACGLKWVKSVKLARP